MSSVVLSVRDRRLGQQFAPHSDTSAADHIIQNPPPTNVGKPCAGRRSQQDWQQRIAAANAVTKKSHLHRRWESGSSRVDNKSDHAGLDEHQDAGTLFAHTKPSKARCRQQTAKEKSEVVFSTLNSQQLAFGVPTKIPTVAD
jgi:hypothetical protein